jgi:hypothetical protein
MLSFLENTQAILDAVYESGEDKILDIGSGTGRYGLLIREDNISRRSVCESLEPEDTMTIDCCEFTPYLYTLVCHNVYNKHFHKSMFELTDKELSKYGLVLMIDVVEHWDKDVIKDFLKRIPGKILISTPKAVCMYNTEYYGDEHTHCSQWFYEDFKDFNTKDYSTAQSYILLLENK